MQKKVYIFLTLLFFVYNLQACVFTKSLEIELFKAVLSENMYESLGNGIKIKNPTIGKLLKEILNTSLGLVLLKQLSVLLPKLKTKLALQESSHVKINLMGIHGCSSLSAMVINNEWVINIQNIPVPRKIAVKCSKGFKFYTIQIPPYIVLSHELLHCFFRLVCITKEGKQWNPLFIEKCRFINQKFLSSLKNEKIGIEMSKNEKIIKLFGDNIRSIGKACDEFSVIVGYNEFTTIHNESEKTVCLSETSFLQEYLKVSNCFFSYGHLNAENIKEDLLTLDLIEKILKFDFVKDLVAPEKATDKDIKKIEEYVQHSSNLKRNSFLNNILTTHEIHNVLGDGNCGIYAILEAGQRFENFRNLIQAREILNYNFTTAGNDRETIPQWQTAKKFREFLFTPNENLYYMAEGLSDPLLGSRELSTDSLLHIAQRIGLTIVLVTEGNTLVEVYYPNGTIEIIDNNSHIKLNECICLYYHDNHFQAIVPKETLQGTPPN